MILSFKGSDDGYFCIDSQVLMKLKEIHRNQAILPVQGNRGSRVLSEQVGDKGLILAFRCRMTIKSV